MRPVLALVAVLITLATGAVAAEGKYAVIFVDDNVTDREFTFQSPRILLEKSWYESRGYKVSFYWADDELIAEALIHPDVGAVSFFGHGSDPKAETAMPTMLFIAASGWTNRVQRALRKRYEAEGMAVADAGARAMRAAGDMKLDVLRVHACSSLVDHSLAEALVRPGGSYFGVPGLYAPCPTPWALFDDVNFLLEEYKVPGPLFDPAPRPIPAGDPTAPGGPCATDLGPAGGCVPGADGPRCIPCPNRNEGVMQYYLAPAP